MYVCLYLYVYLFYYVYCVPCTANRKPVCHFTCGLLTFTEARRDGTSDNSASPAPGLQARRRIPWGCAMPVPPPLPRGVPSTQRLSVRLPGAAACPCRAHSAYADPAAEKANVYALPLYAESAPCNRKSHPACMRGGQSANTLQTTGTGVIPQTIPGNRAEIGKMPALKGFRRCPSAHQMRQLTSYADRIDEPGERLKEGIPASDGMYMPEELAGVHAENRAERPFTPCLANTAQTTSAIPFTTIP